MPKSDSFSQRDRLTTGLITLGQMQAKGMRMLEVACRKCERRGRLSIARLIAERSRDDLGDLRAAIAHDCPRMQNADYELCGVMFSGLPRWF